MSLEMNVETIKKDIDVIKKDVDYIKKMIEELSMAVSDKGHSKSAVKNQMMHLKSMFLNMPLPPDLKKGLAAIFDEVGDI